MKHTDPGPNQPQDAVIYARYSSHSQRDVSIDQQVKADTEYAERQNLRVISIYADRALTGTSDNRPEFQRMIRDAKRGMFKFIIVYSLDRFARDRYDSVVYKRQLRDCGVRVLSAMENITDDPTGALMESLLEGLAEYYSRELSTKIRRGMRDNAEKCLVMTSLPYGYRKGADGRYEIVPEEAAVIRGIFSDVAHGKSLASIIRDLNARGLRTRHGSPWNKNSLKLLSNERYIGYYIYGDQKIENGVPAIVDKETYYAVQEHLQKKANPRNAVVGKRRENSVYLLTGKIFCGHCKAPMVGKSGTSKTGRLYAYYACKNRLEKKCSKENIGRDFIEDLVSRALMDYALADGMIEWLADISIEYQKKHAESSDLILLRTDLQQTEIAIHNITMAIERGTFSPTLQHRLEELETKKADLTAKITARQYDEAREHLSRDEIIAALTLLKTGSVTDKSYQELLFTMFLRAVYLYDDRVKIVFNYAKNGHETSEIPFDIDTVGTGQNEEFVQTLQESTKASIDELREPIIFAVGDLFVLEITLATLM